MVLVYPPSPKEVQEEKESKRPPPTVYDTKRKNAQESAEITLLKPKSKKR